MTGVRGPTILIVRSRPGGSTDTVARIMATRMSGIRPKRSNAFLLVAQDRANSAQNISDAGRGKS